MNEFKKYTITEEEKEGSEKLKSIFEKHLNYINIKDGSPKSKLKIFAVKK